MHVIHTLERFVPRWGLYTEPHAQPVRVLLVKAGGRYWVKTPWAMLDAPNGLDTTDSQLEAALRPCYATEAEALAHAQAAAPHFHRRENQTVLTRVYDAERWRGSLVGWGQLADCLGTTTDNLLAIARGERKATRAQAAAALNYKGGRV